MSLDGLTDLIRFYETLSRIEARVGGRRRRELFRKAAQIDLSSEKGVDRLALDF